MTQKKGAHFPDKPPPCSKGIPNSGVCHGGEGLAQNDYLPIMGRKFHTVQGTEKKDLNLLRDESYPVILVFFCFMRFMSHEIPR